MCNKTGNATVEVTIWNIVNTKGRLVLFPVTPKLVCLVIKMRFSKAAHRIGKPYRNERIMMKPIISKLKQGISLALIDCI